VIDKIYGSSRILEKSLDACWLREEVISQNIANFDTPGYKRKTVSFEEHLAEALDTKNRKRINVDNIDIKVSEDHSNLRMRLDGNNVDIDSEMSSLAKNSIKYNVLIQSLNAGFKRFKSVISEGRR